MKGSKRSGLSLLIVISLIFVIFIAYGPIVNAVTFPVAPVVTIVSGSATQNYVGYSSSCTYLNYFYVFYFRVAGGTTTFYAKSSTDGQTFGAEQTLFTQGFDVSAAQWRISCTGQAVIWAYVDGVTLTNGVHTRTGALGGGTVVVGTDSTGPVTKNGYNYHSPNAPGVKAARVLNGIKFVLIVDNNGLHVIENNIIQLNSTLWNVGGEAVDVGFSGSSYILAGGTGATQGYETSTDGLTWPGAITSFGGAGTRTFGEVTGFGGNFYVIYFASTGSNVNVDKITSGGATASTTILQAAPSGIGSNSQFGITNDGTNIVAIALQNSGGSAGAFQTGYYWVSTDGTGSVYTATGTFNAEGQAQAYGNSAVSGIPQTFNTNLEAFGIVSDSTAGGFNVYFQLFGIPTGGVTVGSQTIGSCPAKNTATFTPANNTIYLYTGNALANEVVNTISTSVASVTSGTHTLRLLIYIATSPTVSVISPLNKAYEKSFSVTAGTTNQIITAQVNVQLGGLAPIFGGNTWAIGLVADDHFRINQSSLSGLTTLAGNPSANTQPASFSTTGTSSVSMIYLCAIASYQLVTTQTITTTAAATTSVTVTNTVSSTVLVNQANPATAQFWFIPLMFLMLPTGIFLGVAILVQGRRR